MLALKSRKLFSKDNKGAVTVDWVVLAGVFVLLTVGLVNTMKVSVNGTTTKIGERIVQSGNDLN